MIAQSRRWITVIPCLLVAGVMHAANKPAEEAPISVPSFGPRYKEIHERIDALYRNRNGNTPLPTALVNPFRPATEANPTPVVPTEPTKTEVPIDSEVILRQALLTLRGGGIVTAQDGQAYYFLNQKRYREGDIISAKFRDKPVSILIKRVSGTLVTFSFDNAEVTVSANQL